MSWTGWAPRSEAPCHSGLAGDFSYGLALIGWTLKGDQQMFGAKQQDRNPGGSYKKRRMAERRSPLAAA